MQLIIKYILDRLAEKSTWIGITSVISAIGVALQPDQVQAIATVGTAIVGGILTVTADTPKS